MFDTSPADREIMRRLYNYDDLTALARVIEEYPGRQFSGEYISKKMIAILNNGLEGDRVPFSTEGF